MQNSQENQLSNVTAANQPATAEQASVQKNETVPSLEELLKKAELAAEELHDAWLRAKAETENVRKRAQLEISSAHKYAIENFASALLAVKDSMEATLTTENATLESLKSGVELTLKLLDNSFQKFKLREINPQGEKFDPHQHQAITTVESDAQPNTVISVMQKGYMLNDRVIRPALVVVGKAKEG
jgi:molecular chaperone GrpE